MSNVSPIEPGPPAGQSLRAAERFPAALPVEISGEPGWMRDVSASGVYFHCVSQREPGTSVTLTVELTIGGEKQRIECEGEVVRVDPCEGGYGVAVRLQQPFFADIEEIDASALVARRGAARPR